MLKWQVTDATQFSRFAGEWDQLAAAHRYPPCMESRFLEPACAQLMHGRHQLVMAFDNGRPVIGGILQRLGWGRWTSFQPSQLPLGAWLMSANTSWQAAMQSLCGALPGPTAMISVTQQDPYIHPRPEPCAVLDTLDYIDTAWVEVRGSFDEFWEARGKNLRQNLRKQRRKIESDGHTLTTEFATNASRVAALLEEFGNLESRGWKSQQGTAISAGNEQGRFYSRALLHFAEGGRALCIALRLDGAPIAVDLCVLNDDSVVILKTTYDEERKALSPGQLLHEEAFRHFFSSTQIRRVEFYGRVMEWHKRWTELSRKLYHVNFYRWGALQALHRKIRARRQATQPVESSA